jgi:hypothetical protein
MNPNAYALFVKALTAHSESKEYGEAVHEWEYLWTAWELIDSHCICGIPIMHVNLFENKINKKIIKIGCHCYENFRMDINEMTRKKIDNCVSAIKNKVRHALPFVKANKLINEKHIKFFEELTKKKQEAKDNNQKFTMSKKQRQYYNDVKKKIRECWKERNMFHLNHYLRTLADDEEQI